VLHALDEGVDGSGDVGSSSWGSLAIGDDAFLWRTAGTGALEKALDTKGVSLSVLLVTAIDSALVDSPPGSSATMGLGGFGAIDGVYNEPVVQILSRLPAIDKGEATSGVGADEETRTHPD
jgi:hypothetical protein